MPRIGISELQKLEFKMLEALLAVFASHSIPYYGLYGTALGAVRHKGTIPWDCDIDLGIPYSSYFKMLDCLRAELPSPYRVYFHDTDPSYSFLFARVGFEGMSHGYLHVDLFPLVGAPSEKDKQQALLAHFNELYRFYSMKKHKPVWAKTRFRKEVKQAMYDIRQFFYPKSVQAIEREYYSLCTQIPYEKAIFLYTACPDEDERSFLQKQWFGEGVGAQYHSIQLRIPSDYHAYLTHTYGSYREFPTVDEQQKGLSFTLEVPQALL
jgi:lipopolysaccharide cholinephosphotransferase